MFDVIAYNADKNSKTMVASYSKIGDARLYAKGYYDGGTINGVTVVDESENKVVFQLGENT